MNNSEHIEPPPEGLNHDDLASTLLLHMGVARMQMNMLAASEALKIKSAQPGFTPSKAYIQIIGRWKQYQRSANYRSEFRRKVWVWLSEGDYDNPQSWGDSGDLAFQQSPAKKVEGPEDWARDRAAHPEKYISQQESSDLWKGLQEVLKGKRMPSANE